MPFIKTINVNDATSLLKEEYDKAQKRAGKVFNVVKLSSLDPHIVKISMDFYVNLMHRPSSLERVTKEMIAVVVSQLNRCFY